MQTLLSQTGKKKEATDHDTGGIKNRPPTVLQEGAREKNPNQKKHPTVYRLHELLPSPVLCAGPQPSAKNLLSWNQLTNYIVTGGFKILAGKCNKINKNQLGKFCLTTPFLPHPVHCHVERSGMNQPILAARDKPGCITAPLHGEHPPKGSVYPAGANAIPTQSL